MLRHLPNLVKITNRTSRSYYTSRRPDIYICPAMKKTLAIETTRLTRSIENINNYVDKIRFTNSPAKDIDDIQHHSVMLHQYNNLFKNTLTKMSAQ